MPKMSLDEMLNDQLRDEELVVEALAGIKTQPFLKRVSSIPLVEKTVNHIANAYVSTKNVSGVIKYSAEFGESVTMAVTKPVLNTLQPVLNPLDRFACNQLDRVEKRFPSMAPGPSVTDLPMNGTGYHNGTDYPQQMRIPDRPRQESTAGSWPGVVGSVGATVGVLREETVKALRYCLELLQNAIHAMSTQITILKNYVSNGITTTISILRTEENDDGTKATTIQNLGILIAAAKKEIVLTLRKVVDLLGKYSSPYLPLDARQSVKQFILNLPSRMQNHRQSDDERQQAEQVIMLASESKKMLTQIESVIADTVEGAEYTLGVNRSSGDSDVVMETIDVEAHQ